MGSRARAVGALVVSAAVYVAAIAEAPDGVTLRVVVLATLALAAAMLLGYLGWAVLAAHDATHRTPMWTVVAILAVATIAASATPEGMTATVFGAAAGGLFGGLAARSNIARPT